MIFSSYRFIFGFFPIVFAVFAFLRAIKKPTLLKIWLIIASLAFYALGQPDFFLIFLGTVLFNYLLIFAMQRSEKKWIKNLCIALSVAENLGLLVYFKYTNFIIENINRVFGSSIGAISLILPIGISFFTFQILASVVSAYKGELSKTNIGDYMLFITFFPQLIVGPVVMYEELLPQLEGDCLLKWNKDDIMRGILLFSVGAAKKVILANPLIDHASAFYSGNIASSNFAEAWLGVLAFTFAYYFDFSGYIDMARGLGLLFGIKLPVNFDSPYKATDFADFWRRWNITVSRFFNNTVFGNLFGFGDRIPKLIFATIVTFLVSGLWHGASWHYIIWGFACGVLVAVSNVMALYRVRIPKWLGWGITFVFMMLVRVLFDAECTTDAIAVYGKLFSIEGGTTGVIKAVTENLYVIGILMISAAVCFFFGNANSLCSSEGEEKKLTAIQIIWAAFLLVISLVNMSSVSTFLYFSF